MGATPQSDLSTVVAKYGGSLLPEPSQRPMGAAPQSDLSAIVAQYGGSLGSAPAPQGDSQYIKDLLAQYGSSAWQDVKGLLAGYGQGGLQTINAVSKALNKIPVIGERLAPAEGINAVNQLTQPQNGWQRAGQAIQQGLEGIALGGMAPEAIPLEGAAGAAANIAAQGGVGALSNAMHGGSPLAGAAIGAGGEGALQAARAAAPGIVNSALGFGWKSKQFGRDPGTVILDETKGLRPQTLLSEVRKQIDAHTDALDAKAAADPNLKVSLEPVQQHILDLMEEFHNRNVYDFDPYLEKLWDHVTFNKKAKVPFPPEVSGEQAVRLKRGLGDYVSEGAWRPGAGSPMDVLAKDAQHVLGDTINKTIPGAEEENWLISNLLEAERRLKIVTGSMGPWERAIDRVTRPTGSLAGAILGGQTGGVPGAIATIAAQEALRSPTVKLMLGRAMYAAPPLGAPIVRGIGLPLSTLATRQGQ